MKNFTKITAIYTIVYAITSFILLVTIGVFTVASRGIFLFSILGLLPFLSASCTLSDLFVKLSAYE